MPAKGKTTKSAKPATPTAAKTAGGTGVAAGPPSAEAVAKARGMLNFDVVAIWSRPLEGFQPGPLLGTHLDFMVGLEKRGLLLMSGPLITRDGEFGKFGLTVLNVATIAEAEAIWANEPFLRAGQRAADYYVWRLMEGRLPVAFDLSDQRVALRRDHADG